MANKRKTLIDQARQGVRNVNPSRLAEKPPRKRKGVLYKPATFSFHPDQIAWIEATTNQLRKAGYPKPGLSLVVQEAVSRMQEATAGKNAGELLADILASQAKRARDKGDNE